MSHKDVILGDSPYPPVPKTCDLCGGRLRVKDSERDEGAALAQAAFTETYHVGLSRSHGKSKA
jgi:hypothetical protein